MTFTATVMRLPERPQRGVSVVEVTVKDENENIFKITPLTKITYKVGDTVTVRNMRSWGWAVGMYEARISKKRKQPETV